ncbi:hypothetical protein ZIOFF_072029 [Zingiber officinale]|uniref:Retrovirus-related Pol polyprotein from transposon TNT 1-94-like beta-barrel domain-containing protein n=1 Tax=Zingiber officinale TaxID=94328 RepID=A0A8J5ETS9_ZINOF|nr:hypothetical protein ZIOFF_072029 [Zingiber officinale]
MKTLFRSQNLWDLVEKGFDDEDADKGRLKENRKKDSKALFILQQAIHETIFSRIATASFSKEAWEILQKEFQGSSKVIAVKLQTLRSEFEALLMKGNETLQDFLSRKMLVRLGDNKQIQVEGKGTIVVKTSDGKVKLLYNVYFIPSLAHSLLSVGQLMMGGYAIVFDNGACVISDKDSGKSIVSVQMT